MKYSFLLFLSLYSLSLFAQTADSLVSQDQLVGIWQVNTARMGDAFLKNFQFFSDGKYILNFDNYDDTKRILSVSGHYRLAKNELFLTVESRKEVVGGNLIKGSPGFQRDEFVLDGGKVEVIKQEDTSGTDPFLISICNITKSGNINCVKIDNNKYYKLSSNPLQFAPHK